MPAVSEEGQASDHRRDDVLAAVDREIIAALFPAGVADVVRLLVRLFANS